MNRTLAALFVLAPIATASTASLAAGSHGVAVSATILSSSNCRFDTGGPALLGFGNIDPSSTAPVTASVAIRFRCAGSTPNATYAITSDDGLHETAANNPRMRHGTVTTEFLPYSLNVPYSATVPKNVDQTFTLVGTITPAAFANARAGTYLDTVVLTIAP